MIKEKMCMVQTCAGCMEKCQDRRKDRFRWIQWIFSELVLLVLLLAAGVAWYEYAALHKGNYVASTTPGAVAGPSSEAPAPGQAQLAKLYQGIFAEGQTGYNYYAGPVGGLVKGPEEITVVIDPGHGGVDEGCARRGVKEKDVNLSIALGVRERLEKLGYQVVMTRDTDESLSLGERVQTAEEAKGDIFVSIHQNSSDLYKVNGLEVYYSTQNAKGDSLRLSELIHGDVLADTGAKARSIFEWENIRVIREAKMPACLIETGFLTNAAERRKLADPVYQGQLADGIASGIHRYFQPEVLYLTVGDQVTEKELKTSLNALKEQNVKATFFLSGRTLKEVPELAVQLVEAGHTIGMYGSWKDYKMVYADVDHYLADLKDTCETITEVTGEAPVLFLEKGADRTDSAASSELIRKLEGCGLTVYDWTPGLTADAG